MSTEAPPPPGASRDAPLTYADYLAVDELLALQRPRSPGPEHDEMLFIVIHQVYELWFKEMLHELDYVEALLGEDDTPRAMHTLKRVLTILKVMVAQLDILETMTPLEFLAFRERLDRASGFQSAQFRELEFLLGVKDRKAVSRFPPRTEARRRLEERYGQPTLWDVFVRYLAAEGYPIPEEVLNRDVTQPVEPSPGVQAVLVDIYRNEPTRAQLCERLVDLDEGMQEWRYRHVKMVERTIGTRGGTGGSSGAEYLRSTVGDPIFPDLWAIRAQF